LKIGIAGAGIAGLRTAQLLEAKGHHVTVFEARDRVGGRLQTVPIPSGGFYEAGGEWIDADHQRVLALLSAYELEPEASTQWPGHVVYQGTVYAEDGLPEEMERDAEFVHEDASELCQRIGDRPWEDASLEDLDAATLSDYLDRHSANRAGRWWLEAVQRSDEGDDTKRVGLLGWLVGYRHYLEREPGDMSLYRIPGGGGRLCERMAEGLARPVRLGKPVSRLSQTGNTASLGFEDHEAVFDRVIVTLPPSVLRNLSWSEAFPIAKRRAWEAMGSARAVKVALRFTERFWEGSDWTGRMLADLPFQQIWDGGQNGAAVLNTYVCGDTAEWLARRDDPVQTCLRAVAEVAPVAADLFIAGKLHDWIDDPFSQGAFASLAPGAVFTSLPHLAEPVGRIHFAGESTAKWLGFIEGALESAERVVREIEDDA